MLAHLAGCLGLPQDTPHQSSSPRTAATAPPAPPLPLPLPPADLLPLAEDSLAFAVPPSLDAALDVLDAQHPASPQAALACASSAHVTETAAACAASLRSYRQRMAPEQRRRERRRLSREQADHLKTLEHLGRGLKVPPPPAALPPAGHPADGGAAAQQAQQQQRAQQQALPPFSLAPVFQTSSAEATIQLVPLHRSRPAPPPPQAAGAVACSRAVHAAGEPADAAAPPSSAGSASMQSASSRLAGEDALAASSGSCSAAASAAPLLPRPSLGRGSAAATGSGASLAASTLAQAAGGSTSPAWQDGTSTWAACEQGPSSGSAAWEEDLIELELVDAAGACVQRLPPQQAPPAHSSRAARPSPDTEEAVPAQTTPSFLAFVVGGVTQMDSLAGGGSACSSGCQSTAASRPAPQACGAAAIAAATGSPDAAAERSSSGGSFAQQAGLPAVSCQAALLDGPEARSSGSPCSAEGSRGSNSCAASGAASAAGSAGALLSSFKRVLHGRLQQRVAGRQAVAQPLSSSHLSAAGKQQGSTHVVAVASPAVQLAVCADAEDVQPRRPGRPAVHGPAATGRRSADENRPVLA
ncbi:hypothetical protein C2E21_8212 [Chlorella sorokiniana]|uniref:Uncharacterized protein n=1 Tax=Chlorella sorokiniana TaxID=3076 RepID=A0A2P6TEU8_CHLSO|nr:hypothetical protein C2E21_8212 [Chlorella sorokiniana]|eukprot:PRW32498.1 hypothetical protein C2E21_8212 [Chlorella sorokiniana]